jgi:hypothetical protein
MIDKEFRRLDSQMRLRLEQRNRIEKRLKNMLVSPRPDYLATSEERILSAQITRLEEMLGKGGISPDPSINARIRRLRGILTWHIHIHYDRRLTEVHHHLQELNDEIDLLKKQYTAFVRTRQAATQSYDGYEEVISRLWSQIITAHEKVEGLMEHQGHMLETMAVNELTKRRERLSECEVKARFAVADSYDRATRELSQEKVNQ